MCRFLFENFFWYEKIASQYARSHHNKEDDLWIYWVCPDEVNRYVNEAVTALPRKSFHLSFEDEIFFKSSQLRIVMMWHAVLHHYDLFRHGAPLFNSTEEDPYTLVVEQVPESRVSGTLSTMKEWVEGKFTKVFFIFCQIFPKARARAFTSLRLKFWYAPFWKIFKNGKNLAKNEKKPCLTCRQPISSWYCRYPTPGFRVPIPPQLQLTAGQKI